MCNLSDLDAEMLLLVSQRVSKELNKPVIIKLQPLTELSMDGIDHSMIFCRRMIAIYDGKTRKLKTSLHEISSTSKTLI